MNPSDIFSDYMSKLWVKDRFVEPYKPNHNPTERKAMGTQKEKLGRLMIDAGCEKRAWFRTSLHVSDVHNHTASNKLG